MLLPIALIVDDDSDSVRELSGLLLAGGHCSCVITAANGSAAVNVLFIRIGT